MDSQALDTQLIASWQVGCFKFPFFVLALSCHIHSCQLALMYSLKGRFIHPSIGCTVEMHPPENDDHIRIAGIFHLFDAVLSLVRFVAINNQQAALRLLPIGVCKPVLVFICRHPAICWGSHSYIGWNTKTPPDTYPQWSSMLLKHNHSWKFLSRGCCCKGYSEALLFSIGGLDANGPLPSLVIRARWWHVKSTHGLVHIYDTCRANALSLMDSDDTFSKAMKLICIICR